MIEHEDHKIPTRLDDKGKFLFFDYDVAMVSLIPCLGGMAIDYIFGLLGLIIGISLAIGYKGFKAGKHDGMIKHISYWKTGLPSPKKLPKSHDRNFNG